MHHYRKHIKDYRADTLGLTPLDHGIYNLLIEECYLSERPLPSNIDQIGRTIGVRTDVELASLNYILDRFFDKNHDGEYTQNRIQNELKAIYEKSEKARQSAQKKWDRQREKEQLDDQRSLDIDQQSCELDANASNNHANASKTDANDMLPSNPLPSNPLPTTQEGQNISPPLAKKFKKPTTEQVADYMLERTGRRPEFEHEKFIDFYESKGWKVGKNPMKDWKAAVRNWLRSMDQKTIQKINQFKTKGEISKEKNDQAVQEFLAKHGSQHHDDDSRNDSDSQQGTGDRLPAPDDPGDFGDLAIDF